MTNKDPKTKFATIDSGQLQRLLVWLSFAGVVAVAAIFLMYFLNFNGGLSKDHAQWGAFGDFVGGVLNPTLSFFGFIALLLTILLQGRQIELSRQELQATRMELARSAEAQERAERALTMQVNAQQLSARLTALSALLDTTNADIERVNKGESTYDLNEDMSTVGKLQKIAKYTTEKYVLISELREIAFEVESQD